MQIQKIQSNNTNFGYNPLINAKLMNDLSNAKKNKDFCEGVRELCSITNKLERKLRSAEENNHPQLKSKLAGLFLPFKIILTDLIDVMFPSYEYKNKEIETYSDEIAARHLDDKPDHWLNKLVKHMHENISDEEVQTIQENAENINEEAGTGNPIESILKTMFPGATIVSTSLVRAAGEDNETEDEDDFDSAPDFHGEEALEEAKTPEEREKALIEIGKDKVVEFEPSGNALKGFDGLGGMKELKAELIDKVVDFLKDPEQARLDNIEYGTKLPKGLLFYGPPGCGKTTVVKHLAVEAGVPLYMLETGRLKTEYYHQTSKFIDAAFTYAASKATPDKPVIMLIDDADSFFVARNERTTQFEGEEMTTFLKNIQEAPDKNVIVALTTNKYDIMDRAIRRRFDTQVYVGLPDEEARISLLKLFLNKYTRAQSLANNEEAIKRLAKILEGFPISAIENMTDAACDLPRRESKAARQNGKKDIRRDVTEADMMSIIAKPESQNEKVKEEEYKTNATRKPIGF